MSWDQKQWGWWMPGQSHNWTGRNKVWLVVSLSCMWGYTKMG